jgi:hypothetical protein
LDSPSATGSGIIRMHVDSGTAHDPSMSPLPAPQVPQSFEARVSTTKQLGLVAIGIALVALIGLAPSRDLGGGWAVHLTIALLIGSFFVPAILELRRAGPAIVMNDAGIDDRRLGVGPIRGIQSNESKSSPFAACACWRCA